MASSPLLRGGRRPASHAIVPLALLCSVLGAACARQGPRDVEAPAAGAGAHRAGFARFLAAWERVAEGGVDAVADGPGFTIERAESGAMVVEGDLQRVAGGAARRVPRPDADRSLAARVRASLEAGGALSDLPAVEARGGVVILRGRAPSPRAAALAAHAALGTPGVTTVVAALGW